MHPSQISIENYTYELPEHRIPLYPLPQREASKLLLCDAAGQLHDRHFYDLPELLPENALLVFNNTRVVPARLFFAKETGAVIEVFCLNPAYGEDYAQAFAHRGEADWECVVGNSKKWKEGRVALLNPRRDPVLEALRLRAEWMHKGEESSIVRFTWEGDLSFAELLERCGNVPIPPYIKRAAELPDKERYQTYYAKINGSVAAPTAGLHFSAPVLEALQAKGVKLQELTLHVGAGTFRPVKAARMEGHPMHSEPFSVSLEFLECLRAHKGPVFAVGTTSCRCLESLYYFALQIYKGQEPQQVEQWEPYADHPALDFPAALDLLIQYLKDRGMKAFHGATRILIAPSFTFRCIRGLVTNFHQPKSTLLLLVAALVGPKWQEIYQHALAGDYRFLSYGDSSLLYQQ